MKWAGAFLLEPREAVPARVRSLLQYLAVVAVTVASVAVRVVRVLAVVLDVERRERAVARQAWLLAEARAAAEAAERREMAARAAAIELAEHYRAAAEASRAKDWLLAVVSHELRSPLQATLHWLRLLRRAGADGATIAGALDGIEQSTKWQCQLVNDLLDVSRIWSGNLRLALQQSDPASAVQAAVELVRPAAEEKSVRVHAASEPGIGPIVADPMRLEQIAVNLLSNAVKFTPPGGGVSVRLRQATDGVELVVSDTGQGIPAEILPHVFDGFRQAAPSVSRHGGLGLGLAIVRHLVACHGGTVEASSPGPGQGASFTVRLPVAPRG